MDIHFACESLGFSLSRGDHPVFRTTREGEFSPYFLRGLACAKVEDESGPPDEWQYLSLAHVWTIERLPLRTTVRVVSDAQWEREVRESFAEGRVRWSDELLSAAEELKRERMTGQWEEHLLDATKAYAANSSAADALAATYSECLADASASVCYVPAEPDSEYRRFREGLLDARLQITLRLTAAAMDDWSAFWTHRSRFRVPALSVVLQWIRFSETLRGAAGSGLPTWQQFLEGTLEMPVPEFRLSAQASWHQLAFDV